MTSDNGKVGIVTLSSGSEKERDLSHLDWSLVRDISQDARVLLFDESGEGAGSRQGVYLRKTDGSPAVRLGDGTACGISPDGRWVLSLSFDDSGSSSGDAGGKYSQVALLPAKAGQPKFLPAHGLNLHRASWMPDGKRVLLAANESGGAVRLYGQSLEGEKPVPITPEGITIGSFPVSPDGKRVVAQTGDGAHYLFPLEGGEPESVAGLGPDDRPIRFSSDGRSLYGFRRGELPSHIFRLDLASAEKTRVRDLMPADSAGVVEIVSVVLTADAANYAYSYHRILSDLFLVEGVK